MQSRPPGRSWWWPATSLAASLRRRVGVPARVGAVAIAVLLLAAACGSSGADLADLQNIPGTTQQQLIADRNDPAVLLIITEYKATISVPTLGYNDGALQSLADQVAAEAESGQIGSDQKTLYDTFVAGIAQNPGAYFTANQPVVQQDVTLDFQCTGSIVTPDGYIVTAAHCTQAPSDELQQDYVQQGLKPMLDAAVQKFLTDNPGFDSDQQQKLSDAVTAYLAGQAQLSNQTEALAGAMFSTSSSGDRQGVAQPLSLVTQGNAPPSSTGPFGDKDVSILKLDGYSNLPTLPVGSDANIDAGQQLFIDGYPAAADAGGNTNLQNLGTPTLSAGSVSSKKTSDQGVPLLETTATVSGGNSGGPGFDQDGNMVGIVSYGGSGYNYLIGGSVVEEFLHEKNIQPRQSQTTTVYDTALNAYYRHYYKQALPEFQQVKGLDPSHPYVDGFIQKTQTAIAQGLDQTPTLNVSAILILVAGVVGLAVIAGGAVTFFAVRRRRSRAPQPPPAADMSPAQSMLWPAPAPSQQPPAAPFPQQTIAPPAGPAYAPTSAAPVPQSSSLPPSVTPPPGWAWDGIRWVPTAPTAGDPSAP